MMGMGGEGIDRGHGSKQLYGGGGMGLIQVGQWGAGR